MVSFRNRVLPLSILITFWRTFTSTIPPSWLALATHLNRYQSLSVCTHIHTNKRDQSNNPNTLTGCAHAQQIIWQLFNAIEKGFAASGDTDTTFLNDIRAARSKLDKGLHIGSWGQLQEWKVEKDSPTDTHRHLSHLIGLFPGYAVASYDPSLQGSVTPSGEKTAFTKQQVIDAARTSLVARGNGTGPDADSGWEKAWRAAAYAQLGDKTTFYHILTVRPTGVGANGIVLDFEVVSFLFLFFLVLHREKLCRQLVLDV